MNQSYTSSYLIVERSRQAGVLTPFILMVISQKPTLLSVGRSGFLSYVEVP